MSKTLPASGYKLEDPFEDTGRETVNLYPNAVSPTPIDPVGALTRRDHRIQDQPGAGFQNLAY